VGDCPFDFARSRREAIRMTAAAGTAQQVPLNTPPMFETSRGTAEARLVEPRFVPHAEAQRSPDPVTRLTAQVLSTVTRLVPCGLAIFSSFTRRMQVGDAVVLEHAARSSGPPIDLGFYRARLQSGNPFAPTVAARTGTSLLTVEDVGGAVRLANSAYGRQLHRAGLEHQVTLYLRAVGGVRAMIALFRAHGARHFDRGEVQMLRHLQPLIEQAHASHLGTDVAEPALTPPALTRREAEVAALVARGASNAEIATALNVELVTVKTHLTQIYAKFGLRSRTQLALQLNADG
jgi:DNA-binding CsgD family transcriptional regulator